MKRIYLLAACCSLGMLTAAADEPNLETLVETPEATSAQRSIPDLSAGEYTNWAPALNSKTFSLGGDKVAEEFKPTFKAGGYIVSRYNISDQKGTNSNGGFDIRLFRLYGNGYVWRDFYYRFQFEMSNAPGVDRGPRVIDAFAEWQRLPYLKIAVGQMKRCFGFENPMAPLEVGFGQNAQVVTKLQSLNDRIGEHPSGGRDGGVRVQGDFLTLNNGHRLFHYQLGLYNGQGINHRDVNKHKDLIAGFWVSPIKALQIGAFGWDGRYTNEADVTQSVDRTRYGLGLKYESDWTVRAEYVHSVGSTLKGGSNRSDGWYSLVGVPVKAVEGLKIYGRWDCYRDDATTWNSLKTDWGIAANYWANKNLLFQLHYYHTYDRSLALGKDKRYNTLDAQVAVRF